jgi:NAD(P)H-dependent FMN reductase
MSKIAIISASVRKGRKSHRVALYFQHYLSENKDTDAEIIDLMAHHFPLFEERLRFIENPSEEILSLSAKIKNADGIIIVTPEYNGGYPASLKNIVDLFYDEWKRKPIAIATVSAGPFGGAQVITSLQFSLWKIGALTIPAMFPVPEIDKSFSETGVPTDAEGTAKRAKNFIGELMFWISAKQKAEA